MERSKADQKKRKERLKKKSSRYELDSEEKVAVQEILTKDFEDIYLKSVKEGECSIDVHEACIYRVPSGIRDVKPEAYTPRMVVIGPLHRLKPTATDGAETSNNPWFGTQYLRREPVRNVKEEYSKMEEIKKTYLESFTERVGEDIIDLMRKIIKAEESKIRGSYSETTEWIKSEDFVDLILHDSVFIMEFIITFYDIYNESHLTGPKFPFDYFIVKNDLILLENQLPFFILDRFLRPIVEVLPFQSSNLSGLIMPFYGVTCIDFGGSFKHFTDLLRFVCEDSLDEDTKKNMWRSGPITELWNVEKLSQAGVEFKSSENYLDFDKKDDFRNFVRTMTTIRNGTEKGRLKIRERAVGFSLYVEFDKGILSMPEFLANKESDVYLRNVIAYEQCHGVIPYTSNYIHFLYFLITSEADAQLLTEEGLITNTIGRPTSVVDMVNKLRDGVTPAPYSQYHDIAKKLKNHCKSRVKRNCATLKKVYFSDVWTGTATVVAVLLLIMTFVSTVATVIQTYVSLKQLHMR